MPHIDNVEFLGRGLAVGGALRVVVFREMLNRPARGAGGVVLRIRGGLRRFDEVGGIRGWGNLEAGIGIPTAVSMSSLEGKRDATHPRTIDASLDDASSDDATDV